MKYLTETIKILVILAIVVVGVGIVQAWTGPTATPPNGNTPAPINVSAVTQEKTGIFGSHGFFSLGTGWFSTSTRASWPPANLTLGINGAVGATQYCDDNGANCKTVTELGGGSTGGMPAGAVMAFDLASCPAGWSAYTAANGRNIIGTGTSGTAGAVNHVRGDATTGVGGEEKHTQLISEMPNHDHSLNWRNLTAGGASYTFPVVEKDLNNPTVTGTKGGGSPFNVMDPYIALLYCKKS